MPSTNGPLKLGGDERPQYADAMTAPLDISVVRVADTWRVRYGSVELDYPSHAEAIVDAIALARDFGSDGRCCNVRMGVMTSCYGPSGFIRAFPSKSRKPERANGALTTPVLPEPEEAAPVALSQELPRRENPDLTKVEKGGRVQRIASAFEMNRHS